MLSMCEHASESEPPRHTPAPVGGVRACDWGKARCHVISSVTSGTDQGEHMLSFPSTCNQYTCSLVAQVKCYKIELMLGK